MWSRIFGIALVVAGIFLIVKTQWMLDNFGRIAWAEQKLGTEGGTRFFYKILGILMIFFGFMLIFGLFYGLVAWIFGPLIR